MASEALNWALANGMTQAELDRNIFNAVLQAQQAGTSNAMLRIEMDRLGISPEDVARATGVKTQDVATKYTAAVPTTQAELIANAAADAELAARTARDKTASQALIDARRLEATTSAGTLTAAQQAAALAAEQDLIRRQNEAALALQQRNAAAAEAARLAEAKRVADNEAAYQKYLRDNQAKSDAQIAANNAAYAEQQRLNNLKNQQQIATNQTAYEAYLANQAKLAAQQAGTGTGTTTGTGVTGTGPFAGATQGFEQNFRNYTSIPIGAQYNPNVVGGTGSPYAQVMGQMKPVGNPYANVMANQAIGGYNPALYDQLLTSEVAKAAPNLLPTTAQQTAQNLLGLEQSSTGGMAQGGMVHGGLMFGGNPPGPDDGAVNLDMGEYVIKKSSVNKYGRGLLDMINEGKVPAKKLKSLLG
jgi:hypothetical protein